MADSSNANVNTRGQTKERRKGVHIKIQAPMKDQFVSTSDWDSHREALYVALKNVSHGTVVEFGCGHGSTPLLEKYCNENALEFISIDTDRDWANKFLVTHWVEDLMKDVKLDEMDLLFIDSKPGEQRKDLIEKYKYKARVIVVHDSEPSSDYVYNLRHILSTFKYRVNHEPAGKPHTTIVSEFIDVSKW